MQYLVDTNIISEIMKKAPNKGVVEWFSRQEEIFFSVITIEEIYYGLSRKNLIQKLTWFKQFSADKATVLEITDKISFWSGEKRGNLAESGKIVTMADSLIAATAHDYGLILATRNIKDFQHFGIAVVNPFSIN
ncbi:MAG: type II toxin-antitoxin system VapC family toxin [Spirochaetia bacterium]|jgi:predicted nucleic acid-binding protein|nr:type II toxin-antitoxin system VapC family toxin [Spirochaetia bacterium]